MGFFVEIWVNHQAIACFYSRRGWNLATAKRHARRIAANYSGRALVIDSTGYRGICATI